MHFLKKLNDQRGQFLLDRAFSLLIGAAALALTISVFGVMFQGYKLNVIASDLTRHIEIRGYINDAEIHNELDRLSTAAGLENVTVDVDSYQAPRIQFSGKFDVTVYYTGEIGIGGILSVPIPLHATVSGRSEKYWK